MIDHHVRNAVILEPTCASMALTRPNIAQFCSIRRRLNHSVGLLRVCEAQGGNGSTPLEQRCADLTVKTLDMHAASGGTHGSPRVTAELRDRGKPVSANGPVIIALIGIQGFSTRVQDAATWSIRADRLVIPELVGIVVVVEESAGHPITAVAMVSVWER
ncbi:hypothetical protein [Nocardia sputorum]|uniref:hypothetical protein n=1 Tax=Nocardia sputorum TaxID=2984338 RepID=UPI0024912F32|nr:hypothetical protein [Nocardia sputorum]